jgi:hypothetical protein
MTDSFEYRAFAGSKVLHIFDIEDGVRSETHVCGIKVTRALTLPVEPPEGIESKGICKACITRKSRGYGVQRGEAAAAEHRQQQGVS